MRPGLLNLFSALSILLLVTVSQPGAQTPQRDTSPRTASISGLVTVGGAPAANALVMVMEVDPQSRGESFGDESQQRAFVKVRADSAGRYRVTGLTEGDYKICAISNAYVQSKNSSDLEIFRSITLDEGESRDDVDIALVRGAVITGRVIDAEGGPLIQGKLRLLLVDENSKSKREISFGNWSMMQTDDRGVYRIYGLPAGRYILSASGDEANGHANRKYPTTFYPDATNQNQAKIIEVKEGAEVTDIDIRLGAGKNTYVAAGRVLDAETRQPLPQVAVFCWEAPDKENVGGRNAREATTDDEGRFSVTGLSSGRYELFLWNRRGMSYQPSASMGSNEHYSEKTEFEVKDSDVSGLEVKAIRGSTISGVVVLEGVNDPAVRGKLQQTEVSLRVIGKRETAADSVGYEERGAASAKIASDGGFRLSGAPPGTASFYVGSSPGETFSIKRIERDGAEIKSAFEIGRGEQITGVRIVLAQANGTIRGRVEITGGKLPEGWRFHIQALPVRTTTSDQGYPTFQSGYGYAVADEKGRFVIERLVAGEYGLTLFAIVRDSQYGLRVASGTSEIKQRVTVNSGAETPVKFTFDPTRR